MKCCKDCTKRFVGCHSQYQKYIVAKVIHTYKRDKIGKEKDLIFKHITHNNTKKHFKKSRMYEFKEKKC